MSHNGYQEIDHTADLALRVWAKDFKTLLRHAAAGMYDLMDLVVVVDKVAQSQHEFSLEEAADEILLVDFLNELVYLIEAKGCCFNEFKFNDKEDRWVIKCWGHKIKSAKRNIKAVTFHNLEIRQTNHGLETTLTFDV